MDEKSIFIVSLVILFVATIILSILGYVGYKLQLSALLLSYL